MLFKYDYSNMHINSKHYKYASRAELEFLRHNMIRGMIAMIVHRAKHPRWKVLYELERYPEEQTPEIVQAARDILFAVTGLDFETEMSKRTKSQNS